MMEAMEEMLTRFRIFTHNGKVLGAALHLRNKTYQDKVYTTASPILVLPIWAKDNNPEQLWSMYKQL